VRFPFRVWQAKRPALLFSPLFKHPRELLDIVISERDGLGRSLATHDEFEVKRATVKFLLLASAFPEWTAAMAPMEALEFDERPALVMREIEIGAIARDAGDAIRHWTLNRTDLTVEHFASSTSAASTLALFGVEFARHSARVGQRLARAARPDEAHARRGRARETPSKCLTRPRTAGPECRSPSSATTIGVSEDRAREVALATAVRWVDAILPDGRAA
jgi:hypothetical protein